MPASGFCYTLVNYDLNLPSRQWSFLGNLYYRRTVINACQFFFRLVEMPASGFCYTLVNYDLNLPSGQWSFFRNSNYRRTVINAHQFFFRLVEMTLWLVQASCSLPEWQAIKQTFFHNLSSCVCTKCKHYARTLNRSQQKSLNFSFTSF